LASGAQNWVLGANPGAPNGGEFLGDGRYDNQGGSGESGMIVLDSNCSGHVYEDPDNGDSYQMCTPRERWLTLSVEC
jgi:hypothetical protein